MDCVVTVSVFYRDGMVDYKYCGYIPFCPPVGSTLGLGMSVEVTEVSWSFGNDVLHIDAEWRASEQDELFSGESMWDEGIFWITQEEEMTLDFAFDNASEKDVTDMYQKHLEKKSDAYKSGDISARMPVCLRKESK